MAEAVLMCIVKGVRDRQCTSCRSVHSSQVRVGKRETKLWYKMFNLIQTAYRVHLEHIPPAFVLLPLL